MVLPRIAIIGAGPGGLTLARLLQVHHIPFTLYELDTSRTSRSQGGTLDVHHNTGQKALKEAGLYSTFQKHARKDGAAFKILDKNGTAVFDDDGAEGADQRPEIDRVTLRTILLDSLEEGAIKWGKKVIEVSSDDNSTNSHPIFNIHFDDTHIEEGFDLVVGADGAWSRVRSLIVDNKPYYSGITCIEARIQNAEYNEPELAKRVGMGSCFQFGDSKGLLSQRNGDNSIRTYAMVRVDEDWSTTCGIDWKDEKSKKELIERMYNDWDILSKQLISRSNGPLVARPLHMLPLEINWATRPGVTVIGDAAHLMTPFGGIGVNLAMADALDLSHAIRSHVERKVDWHNALRSFEEKMLTRAAIEAKATFANLNTMFSGDGADVIARKLGELMTESEAHA